MGRRGPPPTPTKLKIARGNPGKRPLNEREPQPAVEPPAMPAWLSPAAKAEWKRIVPELIRLGLLAKIDRAALTAYCQAVAELEIATQTLDVEGRVCRMPILNNAGEVIGERLKAHPCVAQMNAASQRVKALIQEFGLTPASRSRVQAGDKPPAESRAKKFFGGAG